MSTTIEPRVAVPASLLAVTSAVTIGFGAIFALLPDFQKDIGFSDGWLGVITGAAFVAGFFSQVAIGRFADRGYGRLMLIGGVATAAVGCLGLAFAHDLATMISVRVLLGLGEGAFLPAARRVVIIRNPETTGAALGRLGAAQTVGFFTGPPLAAFIASATTLRVPFVVIGLIMVALLPVVARFEVPAAETAAQPGAVRRLLRSGGVRAGLFIGWGLFVAIGVYDSLWARFLKDLGASTRFVGVSLTALALPIAVLGPVAGHWADRVGARRLGVLSVGLSLPFVISYGFIRSYWVITLVACCHSFFDSAAQPASQSQVASSSPAELVAAGQGLLEGSGLLVAAATSLLLPQLYTRWGAAALWCATAACVGACGIAAALTKTDQRR